MVGFIRNGKKTPAGYSSPFRFAGREVWITRSGWELSSAAPPAPAVAPPPEAAPLQAPAAPAGTASSRGGIKRKPEEELKGPPAHLLREESGRPARRPPRPWRLWPLCPRGAHRTAGEPIIKAMAVGVPPPHRPGPSGPLAPGKRGLQGRQDRGPPPSWCGRRPPLLCLAPAQGRILPTVRRAPRGWASGPGHQMRRIPAAIPMDSPSCSPRSREPHRNTPWTNTGSRCWNPLAGSSKRWNSSPTAWSCAGRAGTRSWCGPISTASSRRRPRPRHRHPPPTRDLLPLDATGCRGRGIAGPGCGLQRPHGAGRRFLAGLTSLAGFP